MTDILDRIDAALGGHDDLVFADAMGSVRDLLDGAAPPHRPPTVSSSRYVPPDRRSGREASGAPRMLGVTLDEWVAINLRPIRVVVTADQAAAFARGEPIHLAAAQFR